MHFSNLLDLFQGITTLIDSDPLILCGRLTDLVGRRPLSAGWLRYLNGRCLDA